jgi:hypothetical protein
VTVDLAENVGFGGGCNAGAGVARGRFVVFLNDDTSVDEFWLRELHQAIESDESAGVVTSVLLNVDGTVQEAGSRVMSDSGTSQFARGLSLAEAERAGYLAPREIDYGSAAALAIRMDVFRRVAGFDPIFEPAYYEDVDLQFRVKMAGWRVMLAPAARVTHVSGGSTSSDLWFRLWADRKNSAIFVARWASTLAVAPAQDAPMSDLCSVPENLEPGAASYGRPLSSASEIAAGATKTALVISESYAAWLAARLDEASSELAAHRESLRSVSMTNDELDRLADERGRRVSLLEARLGDLEQRGPLGIVRWQAGLLSSRREAKKSTDS